MSKKILIVDDEAHIREVITFAVEQSGMIPIEATNGVEALEKFQSTPPDLVVLDVMMPDMDGLSVCRQIRKFSDVPILFLSARNDEIDRIIGLEIGGDDYVSKPFSPRELTTRINVILRRAGSGVKVEEEKACSTVIEHGHLKIDLESYISFWKDQPVSLTATEFSLLSVLARRPGKVFVRDSLMDGAYSENIAVSDRTIDSHIRRIRKKYNDAGCSNIIETVHGVGYKIGGCH